MFGRFIEDRLRDLRRDHPEFTRDYVAKLAGMSRQHLWRAMRGTTSLTPVEVAQLAFGLQVAPEVMYEQYWHEYRAQMPDDPAWSLDELRLYYNGMVRARRPVSPDEQADQVRELRNRLVHSVREAVPAYSGRSDAALPRELQIMTQEFRLEAMRDEASDEELAFIDSVLVSPEAIFRQSGYSGRPLTADEQRTELESVIEMLRHWLRQHRRRRLDVGRG